MRRSHIDTLAGVLACGLLLLLAPSPADAQTSPAESDRAVFFNGRCRPPRPGGPVPRARGRTRG